MLYRHCATHLPIQPHNLAANKYLAFAKLIGLALVCLLCGCDLAELSEWPVVKGTGVHLQGPLHQHQQSNTCLILNKSHKQKAEFINITQFICLCVIIRHAHYIYI